MIKPGLERISRLWTLIPNGRVVHVAGTNGKGSVCHYLNAGLLAAGRNFKTGMFTSPHLVHREDSIKVQGNPVSASVFRRYYNELSFQNTQQNIGATDFELMTAAAFHIFQDAECDAWIIECGMGGAHDATNVLQNKALAVITKIGLDHQEFLGSSVDVIAKEKCGIFRSQTPVLYDSSNDPAVIDVIEHEAAKLDSSTWTASSLNLPLDYLRQRLSPHASSYLADNRIMAYAATSLFCDDRQPSPSSAAPPVEVAIEHRVRENCIEAIASTKIHGRLSHHRTPNGRHVLLDGAHNPQGIQKVAPYLHSQRVANGKVDWIVALSEGKPVHDMLSPLLRAGDKVAVMEFGPVDGMPWKKPTPELDIASYLQTRTNQGVHIDYQTFGTDAKAALTWISQGRDRNTPIVGIGSLYLVGDLLRAHPYLEQGVFTTCS